jgi:hypothetical protein
VTVGKRGAAIAAVKILNIRDRDDLWSPMAVG